MDFNNVNKSGLSFEEFGRIVEMIENESQSPVGTWCLLTLNIFSNCFINCSRVNAHQIAQCIINLLEDPRGQPRSRYKLAQLSSFIFNLKIHSFNEAMLPFAGRVRKLCEGLKNEQLGNATTHLLLASYNEDALKPQSQSRPPPQQHMRQKITKNGGSCHTSFSTNMIFSEILK